MSKHESDYNEQVIERLELLLNKEGQILTEEAEDYLRSVIHHTESLQARLMAEVDNLGLSDCFHNCDCEENMRSRTLTIINSVFKNEV